MVRASRVLLCFFGVMANVLGRRVRLMSSTSPPLLISRMHQQPAAARVSVVRSKHIEATLCRHAMTHLPRFKEDHGVAVRPAVRPRFSAWSKTSRVYAGVFDELREDIVATAARDVGAAPVASPCSVVPLRWSLRGLGIHRRAGPDVGPNSIGYDTTGDGQIDTVEKYGSSDNNRSHEFSPKSRTLSKSTVIGVFAGFLLGGGSGAAIRRPHFWTSFLPGLLLGILFSSSIVAIYALGSKNVRRATDTVRKLLLSVFPLLGAALLDTYRSLVTSDVSLADTEAVWKARMEDVKKLWTESVDAIRKGRSYYAVAVGKPGLVTLQYAVDRMIKHSLGHQITSAVRRQLESSEGLGTLKTRHVRIDATPELLAARFYDVGENAMAFDLDINWRDALDVEFDAFEGLSFLQARVPVSLRNVAFRGTVRCVLAPLVEQGPGYGALMVSLAEHPLVSLDVDIAGGEVTRVPWLRAALETRIQRAVADQLLWPRRLVVPSRVPAADVASVMLLSAAQLDALQHDDPLLEAEKRLRKEPALQRLRHGRQQDIGAAVPLRESETLIDMAFRQRSDGEDKELHEEPQRQRRMGLLADFWTKLLQLGGVQRIA